MYAYLQGNLTYKSPTQVYIDVNGVGYLIHISVHTFSQIEAIEKAKLFTHLHVTDDALSIWGFATEDEKQLFIHLISVSGVGPNTARIILSSMSPREIQSAILMDNDVAFKKVKGVGPKTAKRIILDLKDKVYSLETSPEVTSHSSSNHQNEALIALVALGFQRAKVQKVLDSLTSNANEPVEAIIKIALQHLT